MTDQTETGTIVTGIVRLDKRTKDLTSRLQPGDIAVIDHADIDLVAAETLVGCGVGAVINIAESMTGRYPNQGPLVLTRAGIPLIDRADPALFDQLAEGQVLEIDGDIVRHDGTEVARGVRLSVEAISERLEVLRKSMGTELERFAENTISYLRQEKHLLLDEPDLPDIPVSFAGRHALIVVRGADYKEDLGLLKGTGYLRDLDPVLIGVDGGADALLESGCTPDVIIGDFDSVSEKALRCGAVLVVHGYLSGDAPGSERLDALGLDH
ncbi:MAG TPA: putative cytokinetic ring protein SteA, partial [Protaetiibacter sp.]|nr:putative cytokinetic ring protein SteA [Protaetiibacter sp.]